MYLSPNGVELNRGVVLVRDSPEKALFIVDQEWLPANRPLVTVHHDEIRGKNAVNVGDIAGYDRIGDFLVD
jgi:hypothetical protein